MRKIWYQNCRFCAEFVRIKRHALTSHDVALRLARLTWSGCVVNVTGCRALWASSAVDETSSQHGVHRESNAARGARLLRSMHSQLRLSYAASSFATRYRQLSWNQSEILHTACCDFYVYLSFVSIIIVLVLHFLCTTCGLTTLTYDFFPFFVTRSIHAQVISLPSDMILKSCNNFMKRVWFLAFLAHCGQWSDQRSGIFSVRLTYFVGNVGHTLC